MTCYVSIGTHSLIDWRWCGTDERPSFFSQLTLCSFTRHPPSIRRLGLLTSQSHWSDHTKALTHTISECGIPNQLKHPGQAGSQITLACLAPSQCRATILNAINSHRLSSNPLDCPRNYSQSTRTSNPDPSYRPNLRFESRHSIHLTMTVFCTAVDMYNTNLVISCLLYNVHVTNMQYVDICIVEMYLFSTLFKSADNVLYSEVKDSQFLPEKVANKVAKEIFEKFQEYERIYQKVFAGTFAASVICDCLVCILTLCQLLPYTHIQADVIVLCLMVKMGS